MIKILLLMALAGPPAPPGFIKPPYSPKGAEQLLFAPAIVIPTNHAPPVTVIQFRILPHDHVEINPNMTPTPYRGWRENVSMRFEYPIQIGKKYEIQTKVWIFEEWRTILRFTAAKTDVATSFYPINTAEEARFFRVMCGD